jgi:CBS-domain-containing membrane protein
VALKKGPETPVQKVMTKEILYCFDDEDVDEAYKNMADIKVRRLPVVNREKRLVGILALADIANADEDPTRPGAALSSIMEPDGAHSQASEGTAQGLIYLVPTWFSTWPFSQPEAGVQATGSTR